MLRTWWLPYLNISFSTTKKNINYNKLNPIARTDLSGGDALQFLHKHAVQLSSVISEIENGPNR